MDWMQNLIGSVVDKATDAKWVQPYEVQKLHMQALGSTGSYYPEGRPSGQAGMAGLSPTVLILAGVALVAVLMLKD